MSVGDLVRRVGCPSCAVGTVRRIADGQALVDFPGRRTWVELADLEAP